MSVITNRGKQAKESANKKKLDFKKLYIRLKDGDSVRVRVPSAEEYVEYKSHGAFELGIYTQPCILPTGSRCAYDEVVAYIDAQGVTKDDEDHPLHKFRTLYGKPRYLFALYDIDEKMIRLFDASKGQAVGIIDAIEEYSESLDELAFTFKRTGDKNATKYSLSPIIKMKPDDKAKFDEFDGEVDIAIYDQALMPRTFEQQIEELQKAGFPVEEVFGADIADEGVTAIEDGSGDPTGGF
jgi:hypothetical protein